MADIDTIRTAGNKATVYLIIDAPPTLYATLATAAIDEDFNVTFAGGAGGTLGNCKPDMTILVGTAVGGHDIGRGRLRKDPIAGTFYLGGDPSLEIEIGHHLTVIDQFEVWAKHPQGQYLDIDVAYTDQHDHWDPVPVIGSHCVIEAGDVITPTAANSWVIDDTIASYAWTATGSTASSDMNTATPTITYGTSGRFRLQCLVTATSGKTFTGYRYVFVLGANLAPTTDFTLGDITGSAADGNWTAGVTVHNSPTVRPGGLCIVYAKDYFNGTKQSFGPVAGYKNILMVGWILEVSIIRNPQLDQVEFTVSGPVGVMDGLAAVGAGLQDDGLAVEDGVAQDPPPPAWSLVPSLCGQRALFHVAHLRSTLTRCCDLTVEEWSIPVGKIAASDTIGRQLKEIAASVHETVVSDRIGRVFIERDTQVYPVADRAANIPVALAMVDGDWQEDCNIERMWFGDVSQVRLEGYKYTGGQMVQKGALSPGELPATHGAPTNISEAWFTNQAMATELAGLMAGAANVDYPSVQLNLVHNNRLMDIAPRSYVTFTVEGTSYNFIPRRVSFQYAPNKGYLHTLLELEQEGDQWPAVKINYPGDGEPPPPPPSECTTGSAPSTPPPGDCLSGNAPTEPPPPPPSDDAAAIASLQDEVRTADDMSASPPTWTDEVCTATIIIDADKGESLQWGDDYYYCLEKTKLWRTANASAAGAATWENILDVTTAGLTPTEYLRVRCAPRVAGLLYVLAVEIDTCDVYLLRSADYGETWTEAFVEEDGMDAAEFTVTVGEHYVALGDGTQYIATQHARFDGTETNNPWGMAFSITCDLGWPDAATCAWYNGGADSINNFSGSGVSPDIPPEAWIRNSELSAGEKATVKAFMEAYFGRALAGTAADSMPKEVGRIYVYNKLTKMNTQNANVMTYCFWKYGSVQGPRCIDVSRQMSVPWLYIGTKDKIFKSYDGGYTFTVITAAEGANDLAVSPLLPGVASYWSTAYEFKQIVGETVQPTVLLTETPANDAVAQVWGRICYEPLAGGTIWTFAANSMAYDLKMRSLGAWSTLRSAVSAPRGLHAYVIDSVTTKLIYIDVNSIQYSVNSGGGWTAKEGAWTIDATPVNVHIFAEAP